MKELKLFVCEVCGTNYKDKEACLECERSHIKPKKIVGARYIPLKDNKAGYPMSIDIEFEDGVVKRFRV